MEKELKSCTGVLLRADLTGHGHSSPFCQNGWDGRALLGQPSKGHPCRILILFPYCSMYYIISTTYKKIGDLFCLVIFLDFGTVCAKDAFLGRGTLSVINLGCLYLFKFRKMYLFFPYFLLTEREVKFS